MEVSHGALEMQRREGKVIPPGRVREAFIEEILKEIVLIWNNRKKLLVSVQVYILCVFPFLSIPDVFFKTVIEITFGKYSSKTHLNKLASFLISDITKKLFQQTNFLSVCKMKWYLNYHPL